RFVVLVTIGARQIAPAHRDDVHQHRVACRGKGPDRVADPACKSAKTACLGHNELALPSL
ncbi:MAG TPA: hypothetical protein VGO07_00760, partial [Candidatus Saccharimonadales bacterium]|nr:hypothetical protein [Candidatus Saccharimonadales bacterium]